MTQLLFDKLSLPMSIKTYFGKMFRYKSIVRKCNKNFLFDKKHCEEDILTSDKNAIIANKFKRLYLRIKLIPAREKVADMTSQKYQLTQKSNADLHRELMIMFHEAKKKGSIVETRLQMLEVPEEGQSLCRDVDANDVVDVDKNET